MSGVIEQSKTQNDAQAITVAKDLEDIDFLFTVTEETELKNYHQLIGKIRDEGTGVAPVWLKRGWPGYLVTRPADIEACYKDWEIFSSELSHDALTAPFMGKSMAGMEGRNHIDFRKLVNSPFKKKNLEKTIRPQLRQVADTIIDEFASNGSAELMTEFCKKYPMAVIGSILGIPTENWEEISGWARDIFLGTSRESRVSAANSFSDYVLEVIQQRREVPQDDLISQLCTTEIDNRKLTDFEIKQFMMLLFPAGVDTTWMSIGTMMTAILSTPGAKERLLLEPDIRDLAVQETLRWDSPIGLLPRIIRHDTTVGGVKMAAGSTVCLVHSAANRDPKLYENPEQWIVDRPVGRMLSFAFGPHQCLGQHLARMEMRVALEALLERLPNLSLIDGPSAFWGTAVRGPSAVNVSFDVS